MFWGNFLSDQKKKAMILSSPVSLLSQFFLNVVMVLGAVAATFRSEITSLRKRGNMTMTEQEDVKNLDH